MSKPPVIKQSMMTPELQEYAIKCAITAMQEKNTEQEIAAAIRQSFEVKFPAT